jgi:hypothetical protein
MAYLERRALSQVLDSLTGHYRSHGEPRKTSCVIVCSFGYRESGDEVEPGIINEYLAEFALSLDLGKPILAQSEVAKAVDRISKEPGRSIPIGGPQEHSVRYISTCDVLEQCLEIMQKNGWSAATIVAHPFHLPRVDLTARRLGIETAVPPGLKPLWDRASAQAWTRGPTLWRGRELLVSLHLAISRTRKSPKHGHAA